MAVTPRDLSKTGTLRSPAFHWFKSGLSIFVQGRIWLLAMSLPCMTFFCMLYTSSELSQIILASVDFRISFNCLWLKLCEFSYQNLSPILSLKNWSKMRQVNVGPKILPSSGFSLNAPVYRSTSSTWLLILYQIWYILWIEISVGTPALYYWQKSNIFRRRPHYLYFWRHDPFLFAIRNAENCRG